MKKGFLLLGAALIPLTIGLPCQAVESVPESKWIPGWYCPSGRDSYTEENSALAPVFSTGGTMGEGTFANQWGELLTEGCFDTIGDFSEGLAWVVTEEAVGYIDTMGTIVIQLPSETTNCDDFHNGVAFVQEADGDAYYIDKAGKITYRCPNHISLIAPFDEKGIAPAKDLQSGLYGYWNQAGRWEISPQYEMTYSFEGEHALFRQNGNYGVLDRSGAIILPAEYAYIYTVSEAEPSAPALFCIRAHPSAEQLFGLADSTGTVLIEPQTRWMFDGMHYSEGYWTINYRIADNPNLEQHYVGVIDRNGNEIPLPYEWIDSHFRDGLLMVGDSETTTYINTDLEEVLSLDVPQNAYIATPFIDGLSTVGSHDGKHTYVIDKSGARLCEMTDCYVHDSNGVFPEGVCWAESISETDPGSFVFFDPRLKDYSSPWAAEEIAQAQAAGLVTESNDSYFTFRITRRRFAELMANLVEKTTGRSITPAPEGTFSDTDDLWVRKAAALGLVDGLDDGSRFSPNGYINREQLAAMLYRTIQYLEDETGRSVLAEADGLDSFTDAGQVSGWAADSLAALTASGILQGTSGTTLSPKDTTTVEQAILLTLRAYQEFSK